MPSCPPPRLRIPSSILEDPRIDIRAEMVVAVGESPRRSLTFSRKDFDVYLRLRAAGTG